MMPWRWKGEELVALDADDEAQALGDSLPMGLRAFPETQSGAGTRGTEANANDQA